jgi:uncharacterized protein involved in type VI secretion and phage assembly
MSSVLEQQMERGTKAAGISLATGVVKNNLDAITEGKLQVYVPAHGLTLWARLVGTGAGNGAGFFYMPRLEDEVLVAFAGDEPTDAFVIGGLWNLLDRIPVTDPVSAIATRVIRSGVLAGQGQEIELNDIVQSITIKTLTGQKITLDPNTIELTNIAGTVSISMSNATQTIAIKSVNKISLEATDISIKAAAKVSIEAGASASINGVGTTSIKGGLVTIN